MGAILGSLAQSFANRIHQDVAGFLFEFVMIAQPVVEEIALPIDAMFSSGVQMIRHKQAQAAMPDESLVIEFHGGEHGVASVCAAQLVFARRHAVDRDKEPAAVGYPLRNCVRQLFADREIHT
jgi:hypothetical protein